MNDFSLEGKVALITGASSGIGRGTARLFARYGAKVFLAARRENRLEELKAEIEAAGGEAGYLKTDVSSEEDCKAAVKACVEKFGKLDILFNNAGISDTANGLDQEFNTDWFNRVIDTDLRGAFYMIKYSYPEMNKAGGGSVINISSIAAVRGFGIVGYSMAKGGICAVDRALAREFGAMNIRINSICPGSIDTEIIADHLNQEGVREALGAAAAMGRIGTPEDIGYYALYLASDVSSFVTGQLLVVDGGLTC